MNPMDLNTSACQKCGAQADRSKMRRVSVLSRKGWRPAIGGERVYVPGTGIEHVAWTCPKCGAANQRDALF